MVEYVLLSFDFRQQISGVAKFDEEVRPDAHGCPVVRLVPMFTFVFCANLNNLGLENGCLVHGEVSWIMRRKEVEREGLRNDTHE
jgi:hypothetical protein